MTTIKELKEWLNRFPEETIVELGVQQPHSLYESYGPIKFISPKLENNDYGGEGWDFVDFRNNSFVGPESEHFGKCYLRLGEPN